MGKVIYLTGAPASGKSSTTKLLAAKVPGLKIWEYGARLTEHVFNRSAEVMEQDDLRKQSAGLVTPNDVKEVDEALVTFVGKHRQTHNIIIDSHPVTKENFGFRITAFSLSQFEELSPDEIWVLFASPESTIQRISKDAAGRPMVSEEEARFHTSLQASVAATYGISIGATVYTFDTDGDRNKLIDLLQERLS